jgi:hypothetical protein
LFAQSITLGASLPSVIVVVELLVRRHCRGVIGHKLGNRPRPSAIAQLKMVARPVGIRK